MTRLRTMLFGLACLATAPVFAQGSRPPAPTADVPDLRTVRVVVICGDCDQPFDTDEHKRLIEGLLNNPYVGELRRALYLQDSVHQFESKVHFDNCDFDDAIAYIDERLVEVDGHVKDALRARSAKNASEMTSSVRRAFFALGQALHGVQDFYAHSNYVELSVGSANKSTDIDIITPWKSAGRDRIQSLRGRGLVSGYVFWGYPQKCATNTLSHADLAKDSATTKSGAIKIPHLENRSQFQIAAQLAREASQEFIDDAFRRWPLLKEVNGRAVAVETLVDRRGL